MSSSSTLRLLVVLSLHSVQPFLVPTPFHKQRLQQLAASSDGSADPFLSRQEVLKGAGLALLGSYNWARHPGVAAAEGGGAEGGAVLTEAAAPTEAATTTEAAAAAAVDAPPPASAPAVRLPETAVDAGKTFTFQYPSNFVFFAKPVKTHLVEYNVKSEGRKGYTMGAVVDPVKLESLESFGTPDFVGNRIVTVEKGRDGVTGAELKQASKVVVGGVTYYDIDYVNESKRGNNHYAARVGIQEGKLYVLTVQTKIKDFDEIEGEVRAVVDSFRII